MEKKYWEDKEYAYFSHKKCEYFPCHRGADPEDFNCLFCYCPLYASKTRVEFVQASGYTGRGIWIRQPGHRSHEKKQKHAAGMTKTVTVL